MWLNKWFKFTNVSRTTNMCCSFIAYCLLSSNNVFCQYYLSKNQICEMCGAHMYGQKWENHSMTHYSTRHNPMHHTEMNNFMLHFTLDLKLFFISALNYATSDHVNFSNFTIHFDISYFKRWNVTRIARYSVVLTTINQYLTRILC